MSAYFVVELDVTNSEAMEPYRAAAFLVRAGATELIEGGPEPKRIVIPEFAARRRSSAGTTRPSTRKSCRAGPTTRPRAPSSSRA